VKLLEDPVQQGRISDAAGKQAAQGPAAIRAQRRRIEAIDCFCPERPAPMGWAPEARARHKNRQPTRQAALTCDI
jgi:hypothetical protein